MNVRVLSRMANSFELKKYKAGTVIIQEGDEGDFLYAVRNGTLEVTQSSLPGKVDTLEKGRIFGELALIYEAKVNACF